MTVAVPHTLTDLLERAGANLAGKNRADCPKCHSLRTISYTDTVFYCHHSGCDFSGNAFTLAKELGVAKRLTKSEYLAEKCARETAEEVVRQVNARRKLLATGERTLYKALAAASSAGRENPHNQGVWEVLAVVYKQLPRVCAEWTFISYAPALAVMEYLAASTESQHVTVSDVIARGGVLDGGRFADLSI